MSTASVGTVSPGHPMLPSNPFLRSSGVMGGHPGFFYPPLHPLMGKPPTSSSMSSLHHHHHHHPHHHGAPPPPAHPVHGAVTGPGGHSPGSSMLPSGVTSHSSGKYDSQVRIMFLRCQLSDGQKFCDTSLIDLSIVMSS